MTYEPSALPPGRLPAYPMGRAVCDAHGAVLASHRDPADAARHADALNRDVPGCRDLYARG